MFQLFALVCLMIMMRNFYFVRCKAFYIRKRHVKDYEISSLECFIQAPVLSTVSTIVNRYVAAFHKWSWPPWNLYCLNQNPERIKHILLYEKSNTISLSDLIVQNFSLFLTKLKQMTQLFNEEIPFQRTTS